MAGLTKRVCDLARYEGDGNTRCVKWDDKLAGFGLRIYPSGAKSFILHYRPAGQKTKRTMVLGQYGVLTVEQARDRARRELVGVRDGKDPLAERRARERAVTTFADLAQRYLDEFAKLHRKSWLEDQRRIDSYVVPAFGRRRVDQVDAADVRALHSKIGRNAQVEANRVADLIRAIFNKAKQWKLLPAGHENPAGRDAAIKRFKEKSRERYLTQEELKRVGAAIEKVRDPYTRGALKVILFTGCRKTELLRARWENVDLHAGKVRLEDTKTAEVKHVHLSAPAIAVLRDLPRRLKAPWVFPGRKNGQPLDDLQRAWARVRKEARVPDATVHDLRRTVGSMLVQHGVHIKVIGEALGHRDSRSTAVYARIANTQPGEALDMLGNLLGDLLEPAPQQKKKRA